MEKSIIIDKVPNLNALSKKKKHTYQVHQRSSRIPILLNLGRKYLLIFHLHWFRNIFYVLKYIYYLMHSRNDVRIYLFTEFLNGK